MTEGIESYDVNDYLFDLRGFLFLKGALRAEEVAELNAAADALLPLERGQWRGRVHCQDHHPRRGTNLQNIIEGGEPFERLIDHPSWISYVTRYVDSEKGMFIDEAFYNLRGEGGAINIHSGGYDHEVRSQFRFHNDRFFCGQVNVLMALTDVGPEDGATMVVPGSHKSNFQHPDLMREYQELIGSTMDGMLVAEEVHMRAGDVLLFVDALTHGSAARVNEGMRRIMVYRYGPSWGHSRFGYEPSDELLARLTPVRRKMVQPIAPTRPPAEGSG